MENPTKMALCMCPEHHLKKETDLVMAHDQDLDKGRGNIDQLGPPLLAGNVLQDYGPIHYLQLELERSWNEALTRT
jgi:hypothetical protein